MKDDWDLKSERWSEREKAHFAFLHSLRRCALCRQTVQIEVAHIRYLTGAAMKPNWRHTLPLFRPIHVAQEGWGGKWWESVGFPIGSSNDPRIWAERLAEVTGNAEAADDLLQDMFSRADKSRIVEILQRGMI